MDLVEDRMSQRIIGVALIFSFYVMLQSLFNDITDDPPPPVVKDLVFASTLVDEAKAYQPFAHSVKAFVTSDNGSAWISKPVQAAVTKISQGLPPKWSLDCDSQRMRPLRDTLLEAQRKLACTPRISQCGFANSSSKYCKDGRSGFATVDFNHSAFRDVDRVVEVVTDDKGTATFTNLTIEGSPPGTLTFSFTAGDGSLLEADTTFARDVGADGLIVEEASMLIRPGASMPVEGPFVTLGVPFETQPVLIVVDRNGRPLPNRTVTAFAWGHANFFDSWAPKSPYLRLGFDSSHLRGQNFAVLENATSLPSDENGRAVFEGLTVRAASSYWLHLMFYCDGIIASWMDPEMQPTTSAWPKPPKYVRPIGIKTEIESIELVDSSGAPIDCNARKLVKQPFQEIYPLVYESDTVTSPIAMEYMLDEMTRNETAHEPFSVKVGKFDRTDPSNPVFVPLEGVEVLAVVAVARDFTLPFLTMPDIESVREVADAPVMPYKNLRNAVSTPSDADGVASFPDLKFTSEGGVDSYTKIGELTVFTSAHRLAFCTPAQSLFRAYKDQDSNNPATTPIIFDGCALSCPIPVLSAVEKIEWSTQPTTYFIRAHSAPDTFESGELAALAPSKLVGVPTLRMTSREGLGVPGKIADAVVLLDMEKCEEICVHLDSSVTITGLSEELNGRQGTVLSFDHSKRLYEVVLDEEPEPRFLDPANLHPHMTEQEIIKGWSSQQFSMACPACVSYSAEVGTSELATLVRPASPSDPGTTGNDGFVTMPVRYRKLNAAARLRLMERAIRRKLRLYAVMGLLISEPSEPILGFSFPPADSVSDPRHRQCVSLSPYDYLSEKVVHRDAAQRIQPDATGGIGVDRSCLQPSTFIGGTAPPSVTGANCDRSHWISPADRLLTPHFWNVSELYPVGDDGSPPTPEEITAGLTEQLDSTSSWIMNSDVTGTQIWKDVTNRLNTGSEEPVSLESSVVRLIAKNSLGLPVPGLRVRLRNLQDKAFKQLPDSYRIVTCNLNRRCAAYLPRWGDGVSAIVHDSIELSGPSATNMSLYVGAQFKVTAAALEVTAAGFTPLNPSVGGSLPRAPFQEQYRAWYGNASPDNCIGLRKPTGEATAPGSNLSVGMCSHLKPDGSPLVCGKPISAHVELEAPKACAERKLQYASRDAKVIDVQVDASGCHLMITMETAWDHANRFSNCCPWAVERADAGSAELDFTDVCETDENGVVEMAIATSMSGGKMGEFMSSGPVGFTIARYEAYQPDSNDQVDKDIPACSSVPFRLGVIATISSDPQQRPSSTAATIIDNPRNRGSDPTCDTCEQPDWYWTQFDNTALHQNEDTNDGIYEYFTVDSLGRRIPWGSIDSIDFIQTPPYLRGFEVRSRLCEAVRYCLLPPTSDFPELIFSQYGKYAEPGSQGWLPYNLWTSQPHTKVLMRPAKQAGNGEYFTEAVTGNPGEYAYVLSRQGVRSSPFLLTIKNQLEGGSMQITREPDPCTDTGCAWHVGTPLLGATPAVTLLNRSGHPIEHYQPMVRAVDAPHNDAAQVADVVFDISLDWYSLGEAAQSGSAFGMRRGTRSTAEGVSYFPGLVMLDVVNGTCFYLQFYFAARRDLADIVRVTSTTRICAGRGHTAVAIQSPSESIVNEVPFSRAVAVRADTDLVLLGADIPPPPSMSGGNISFWVESPMSYLGVADMGVLFASMDNYELPDGWYRPAVSYVYLNKCWTTIWGSLPIIGEVSIMSTTSSMARSLGYTHLETKEPSGASALRYAALFEMAPSLNVLVTSGNVSFSQLDPLAPPENMAELLGRQVTLKGLQRLLTASGEEAGVSSVWNKWSSDVARQEREMHSGGTLTSIIDEIPVWYSQPVTGEVPTSSVEVAFVGMDVSGLPPTNMAMTFAGATAVTTKDLKGSSETESTLLTSQPAGISLMNQPPLRIEVGEVFLMKVKVSISSGDPLRGQTVVAEANPAIGGFAIDPKAFMDAQFNIQPLSISDLKPALAEERAVASTDKYGIARFSIFFKQAPRHDDPSSLALSFTAGKVKSSASRPFVLTNRMQSIQVTPVDIEYTGNRCRDVEGVGDECVAAIGSPARTFADSGKSLDLSSVAVSDEAFPQDLPVPPFNVTGFDEDGQPIKSSFDIDFRIFTAKELDNYAKALNQVTNFTGDAMDLAQKEIANNGVPEEAGEQLLSTAVGMATMLLSASQMASTGPTQGSKDTQLIFPEPKFTVADGVAMFKNVKLRVTKAGVGSSKGPGAAFYLQAIGSGVGSKIYLYENNTGRSDFFVGASKYNTNTWQAKLTKLGIDIAILLMLGVVVMGNSDFHSPKIWLPISLALGIVAMGLAAHNVSGKVDIADRTLWWLICTVLIMVGYFGVVLGLVLKKFAPGSKLQLIMRPFAEKRKENYFTYVRELFKKPHLAASRALAQGERDGTLTLQERMSLEKEIRDWTNVQRSSKTQLKAIFKNLMKDRDAFNFPVRLYATFVCSVFSVAFIARQFVQFSVDMEQSILKMDVKALKTIHTMCNAVEKAFLKATGTDLPAKYIQFTTDNANKLHGYIISLAESARVAGIVACVLGVLFFAISWVVLVLDFRAKVIQARQGIWTFNVKKIKLYASFTFVGIQISNSMVTFVLIWFLIFLVALILGWKLTFDLTKYILREEWRLILGLAISPIINIVVKKIVLIFIGNKMVIKQRYAWMAYDLFQIFTTCVTGFMTAIVRFILAVVSLLFSLPRTDISIFPAWLEYYLLLDSGAKSYRGVVVVHHMHNNPVMRVFLWTLEEDAQLRRTRHKECGMLPPGDPKIRLRNKFRKRLMMLQNRDVATYRATETLATEKEEEASKKKKKKGGCLRGKTHEEADQTPASSKMSSTKDAELKSESGPGVKVEKV
jgi:hypothetical protein